MSDMCKLRPLPAYAHVSPIEASPSQCRANLVLFEADDVIRKRSAKGCRERVTRQRIHRRQNLLAYFDVLDARPRRMRGDSQRKDLPLGRRCRRARDNPLLSARPRRPSLTRLDVIHAYIDTRPILEQCKAYGSVRQMGGRGSHPFLLSVQGLSLAPRASANFKQAECEHRCIVG
jgi:hypothetical protein